MDQWEGQHFNRSPGNLYSEVQRVHLDPISGYAVRLNLTSTVPAVQMPADTQYVKHIKIQSKLLTDFWGQPMYLGATVLLPEGYDAHPDVHYPVIYQQDHFNLGPPLGFSTEPSRQSTAATPVAAHRQHDRLRSLQAVDLRRFPANDRRHLPASHGLF